MENFQGYKIGFENNKKLSNIQNICQDKESELNFCQGFKPIINFILKTKKCFECDNFFTISYDIRTISSIFIFINYKILVQSQLNEYFREVLALIHRLHTYENILFISHGYGSALLNNFLSKHDLVRKKTIKYEWVSINGIFNPSPFFLKMMTFGEAIKDLPNFYTKEELRVITSSFNSLYSLLFKNVAEKEDVDLFFKL